VLTKDILFGMNVLTLAGFLMMGLSLTLHRTGNAGVPLGRNLQVSTPLPVKLCGGFSEQV
jgi:hypothetical protein